MVAVSRNKYGRHEETRTPDLYRVKMALFGNCNNLKQLGDCQVTHITARIQSQREPKRELLPMTVRRPQVALEGQSRVVGQHNCRNMYGPPPNCKKKVGGREQSAKMYPAS